MTECLYVQNMSQRKIFVDDYVKQQGKLVVQVMKERTSAKEWEKNWGFLKDKKQFLEDEALKQGMTPEEYWSAVKSLNLKYKNPSSDFTSRPPIDTFPKTSSGMVGWRAIYPFEKKEQPNITPLPPKESETFIFLG